MHRVKRIIIGRNFHHSSASNNEKSDCTQFSSDEYVLLSESTSRNLHPIAASTDDLILRSNDISLESSPRDICLEDLRTSDICEEGGIEYVAGYVAMKLFDKFPHLRRDLKSQTPQNG